jgi:hypothetical protein
LAHESFAKDALLAHKMNQGLGGAQKKMHNTIIPTGPHEGENQTMVLPADCTELDKDGKPLAGQAKGMEWMLQECGLLQEMVKNSKNEKVVAVCKKCKVSQEACEKAAKEAKACQDEIEGSGVQQFSERSECEEATEDLDRPTDCCM